MKWLAAEVRVHVRLPVEDLDEVVHVPDLLLRAVLPEQLLRDDGVPGEGLVHGEHVGGLLRLVGAQAARGVQDPAGTSQPVPGSSR